MRASEVGNQWVNPSFPGSSVCLTCNEAAEMRGDSSDLEQVRSTGEAAGSQLPALWAVPRPQSAHKDLLTSARGLNPARAGTKGLLPSPASSQRLTLTASGGKTTDDDLCPSKGVGLISRLLGPGIISYLFAL